MRDYNFVYINDIPESDYNIVKDMVNRFKIELEKEIQKDLGEIYTKTQYGRSFLTSKNGVGLSEEYIVVDSTDIMIYGIRLLVPDTWENCYVKGESLKDDWGYNNFLNNYCKDRDFYFGSPAFNKLVITPYKPTFIKYKRNYIINNIIDNV